MLEAGKKKKFSQLNDVERIGDGKSLAKKETTSFTQGKKTKKKSVLREDGRR